MAFDVIVKQTHVNQIYEVKISQLADVECRNLHNNHRLVGMASGEINLIPSIDHHSAIKETRGRGR